MPQVGTGLLQQAQDFKSEVQKEFDEVCSTLPEESEKPAWEERKTCMAPVQDCIWHFRMTMLPMESDNYLIYLFTDGAASIIIHSWT